MPHRKARGAVVAFGGNALSPPEEVDNIYRQFAQARKSLEGILELIRADYNLVITHGNGPQVGTALRRVELSKDHLSIVPLGVLVSETQGSLGYIIEQSLLNIIAREKFNRRVVTLISQVLVDDEDPALTNPTKFIGQIYTKAEADYFIENEGWTMKPYGKDGKWRRVVGSPIPLGIVNRRAVRELVQEGVILIAGGGGGIPVYRDEKNCLEGVDAVIDKDRVAAMMAHDIEAEELFILTNIDSVKINFGESNEQQIDQIRIREARQMLIDGHFPAGSMGPKVESAVNFVEQGGERAIICGLDDIENALNGKAGTLFLP